MNKYGLTILSLLCLCSIINAMEPEPKKFRGPLAPFDPARRDLNPESRIASSSSSSSNAPQHDNVSAESGASSSSSFTSNHGSNSVAAIRYLPNDLKRFIIIPSELNQSTIDEIFNQAPREIKVVIKRLKKNLDDYKQMPRGVVLYGDHGSGKTTMGQVISRKIGWNLALLSAANLPTQYQNSASDNFSQILEALNDSRERFVIVVDELNGLIGDKHNQRDSKNGSAEAIWQTLDKVMLNPRLFFVGTTNDRKNLPKGLRDRSFCQQVLEIKRPDLASRIAIISTLLPQGTDDNLKSYLARKTDGQSIRTIEKLIYNANGYAELEDRSLSKQDIDDAWNVWEAPFKESPKEKLIEGSKFIFKEVLPIGIQLTGLGWSIYTALRQFGMAEDQYATQLFFQVSSALAQKRGLEMQQKALYLQRDALIPHASGIANHKLTRLKDLLSAENPDVQEIQDLLRSMKRY